VSLKIDQPRGCAVDIGRAEGEVLSKVKDKLLAVISFENVTPTIIGGYNAAAASLKLGVAESVRLTEVKGLWRWWARALLLGCNGRQGWGNTEEVWRKVADLLGSTEKPSRVSLRLVMETNTCSLFKERKDGLLKEAEDYSRRKISKLIEKVKKDKGQGGRVASKGAVNRSAGKELYELAEKLAENIPRTKIIGMGVPYNEGKIKRIIKDGRVDEVMIDKMAKTNAKYLVDKFFVLSPGELRGRIEVYDDLRGKVGLNDNEQGFLVGSLLVALVFGGLGAITSRGFGAVRLSVSAGKESVRKFEELVKKIFSGENVEENLKKLVDLALEYGRRLVKVTGKGREFSIPSYPTVDLDGGAFRFDVVGVKARDSLELLEKIGNATLKSKWKELKNYSVMRSGATLHTWILGLPRTQQKKGYYYEYKVDESRRRSAIHIRPLIPPRRGEEKWVVVLYGFISMDWDVDMLIHHGKVSKKVMEYDVETVNSRVSTGRSGSREDFIRDVFDAAFGFVKKSILGRG